MLAEQGAKRNEKGGKGALGTGHFSGVHVAMPLLPWMRAYMKKQGNGEVATHVLMNGGSLLVQKHELPGFYKSLAQSIARGEPNFVCEQRNADRLKLCIDIDIYSNRAYSEEECESIAHVASMTARDLFSESIADEKLDMLVCTTDAHDDVKDGTACIKTGLHLVWEYLTVDVRTAGIYRDALVQRLELTSQEPPIGGWSIAIDSAIVKHGILRMLYNHKCIDCTKCRNKKMAKESCDVCMTTGKIDVQRAYTIRSVVHVDQSVEHVHAHPSDVDNVASHLARASIRTDEPAICCNTILPSWFEHPMIPYTTSNRPASKRARKALAATLTEGNDTFDGYLDKEPLCSALQKKIQAFIQCVARRDLIDKAYTDVGITSAFYVLKQSIIFAKTDSCFCINIKNEHKSNTVYFELKRCGEMRQKCFCRCDTTMGRRQGLCSAFHSHPVNIPKKYMDAFFPVSAATGTHSVAGGSDAGGTTNDDVDVAAHEQRKKTRVGDRPSATSTMDELIHMKKLHTRD